MPGKPQSSGAGLVPRNLQGITKDSSAAGSMKAVAPGLKGSLVHLGEQSEPNADVQLCTQLNPATEKS